MSYNPLGTGSVSWGRFCLLKSTLMPCESEKLPAPTAAFLVGRKRPRALRGWSNGPAAHGAPPSIPVTASAIPWWLWHLSGSCGARWPLGGAGPSSTRRHAGHGHPALPWSERAQEVPALGSALWVTCGLCDVLGHLDSSS